MLVLTRTETLPLHSEDSALYLSVGEWAANTSRGYTALPIIQSSEKLQEFESRLLTLQQQHDFYLFLIFSFDFFLKESFCHALARI